MSEEKILDVLKRGAMKKVEIAEETGLSSYAVCKSLKIMKDEGKVISPKRCYYGLP